jgi:signal transduction histidine kinase
VARHAGASLTEITVSLRGQEVVLEVLDNGVGVPAAPGTTGQGIPNMVRRAECLGGELVLHNRVEGGSHLACSVPITPRGPSHDRPDHPGEG